MAKKIGVKVFKDYQVPEREGTYYRLLCMTGERKGFSFIIENDRIVLGRSKDADVKVMDVKSSREHAELVRYENTFIITDLGSQNGLVVNDLNVTQHKLKDGDLIVIGATVFKYNILNIKNSLSLTNNDQRDDGEEDYDENDSSSNVSQNKKNNRIVIYILVIGLLAFFMMDDGSKNKVTRRNKDTVRSNSSTRLKNLLRTNKKHKDKDLIIKIQSILHKGLREFREANYFRALEFFNLALNFDPQNGRAEFYLNKTQQRIDQTIKKMFSKAKREAHQLRYRRALQSYCSIIRYLQDYDTDQRYIDAQTNIEVIEPKMGFEKGEFSCL